MIELEGNGPIDSRAKVILAYFDLGNQLSDLNYMLQLCIVSVKPYLQAFTKVHRKKKKGQISSIDLLASPQVKIACHCCFWLMNKRLEHPYHHLCEAQLVDRGLIRSFLIIASLTDKNSPLGPYLNDVCKIF